MMKKMLGFFCPVIPHVRVEYIQIIPYVLAMVVLAGFIGASCAPRALGPYEKE